MALTPGPLSLLIMGYGAFGQALAGALHRRGDIAISVFSRNPPAEGAQRESVSRLIHNLQAIDLGAYDIVILALPSGALASVLDQLPPHQPRAVILSCVKGMDAETHDFPTDLIAKHLPGHVIGMLSGPTFAREMLAGHGVWMSLGCEAVETAQAVSTRLASPLLSLTPTTDLRGLEIIGVAKNIIAIGAGLTAGLGLGENTRASYVARGIAELAHLLPALGGRAETVLSPGGLGDLILTCTSAQSRNYRFGQDVGLRLLSQQETVSSGIVPLAEGSRSITAFLAFIRRSGAQSAYFDGLAAAMAHPDGMAERLTATLG